MRSFRNKTLLGIALAFSGAVAVSNASYAADAQWEIWTGSLAAVSIFNLNTTGASSQTSFNLFNNQGGGQDVNPAIGYVFSPGFEVVLAPGFYTQSSAVSGQSAGSAMLLQGGLNYSFGPMDDSFYATGLIGMASNKAAGSTTTNSALSWTLAAGKRFPVISGVTYAPQVSYTSTGAAIKGAGSTGAVSFIAIVPVQFTVQL